MEQGLDCCSGWFFSDAWVQFPDLPHGFLWVTKPSGAFEK